MGQEAANVHLGTSTRVKRILRDWRNARELASFALSAWREPWNESGGIPKK